MTITLHDCHKQNKLDHYLSNIPAGEQVKSSKIAKAFCLSSAVSAGKLIWMRGDFENCQRGLWRKSNPLRLGGESPAVKRPLRRGGSENLRKEKEATNGGTKQ